MATDNKIIIILVLYKQDLEESKTYNSLKENIHLLTHPYKVIIYNNSPEINIKPDESLGFTVFNSTQNDKLAKAYNYALNIAKQEDYNWILLLDQDSEPPKEYFTEMDKKIDLVDSNTAAIVPHIISDNVHISPSEYWNIGGPFWDIRDYTGELPKNRYLNAINSCSVIRTSSIEEIGGFTEQLPLDYLDCWYYYQFHKKGFSLETIDVSINHHLSIFILQRMGIDRYKDYMKSCAIFAQITQPSFLFFFRLRTIIRSIKQLFIPARWKYFTTTFRAAFYHEK
ncbi:MAG: glycosyltransferase [Paludibacteraceae bacterium]|nr:glycosyltransferase [Paludibacteraceae bacterium]